MNLQEQKKAMQAIKYSLRLVGPAEAQKYLDKKSELQRRPSNSTVSKYVDSLRSGEWLPNPLPMSLNQAGELIDGTHRCMAIVQSGIPAYLWIATNVPDESFIALGILRPRRAAQFLDGGNIASSAIRLIHTYEFYEADMSQLRTKYKELTEQGVVDYEAQIPELGKYIDLADAAGKSAHIARGDNLALMILASRHSAHPEKVMEWGESLATGADLKVGDPRLVMRERFNREHHSLNLHTFMQPRWSIVVKTWNAWTAGRTISSQQLRVTRQIATPPKIK